MARELVYTPLRYSLYFPLYKAIDPFSTGDGFLPIEYRGYCREVLAALAAGGIGAVITHPLHVMKIRMMANEHKVGSL